jgi:hypothetical protein
MLRSKPEMQLKFNPALTDRLPPHLKARVDRVAGDVRAFAADLGGWLQDGLQRVTGAERRALTERFTRWAEQGVESTPGAAAVGRPDAGGFSGELRVWFDALNDDGQAALTEQLAAFCRDFDIDLAWLVDGELADRPALEGQLQALVIHYCLACKAAVEMDPELIAFRRRRVWQRKLKTST